MKKSSAPRRFAVGLNVIIQIILAGVILVFLNLAIHRWHPPKLDISYSEYYKLSDKTKELLKSLTAPVDVIVFFQPEPRDPVARRVSEDIQVLLKEYQAASRFVKVKFADPDRDLASAEEMDRKYHVKVPNVVVFAFEKRSKFVQVDDLVELDSGNSFEPDRRIKAFKGEQQFTSAIQNVLDVKQPKIYFLQGHGEGDPQDYDRQKGFSNIAKYIQRDNLLVEKLNLFEKQQIPKDCDLLVICGPAKALSELELTAIQQHLGQNGRLMVLLDAMREETGLEKLLLNHGVRVGNDLVMSIGIYLGGRAIVPEAHGTKYGFHAITKGFEEADMTTYFPRARSVDRAPSAGSSNGRVTVLVETPEGEWGESNLTKLQQEQKAEPDEKDRKGPVPVAVCVEPSAAGEMEREGMRMVIVGSSQFIRNDSLESSNLDLFMNALNWLLKRQQLIGIAPKAPQEFTLSLDMYQRRSIFLTEVVAVPLGAGVIGFLVWLRRRK